MIHIDGSYGEGGGQILRTALSLSSILQVPFHILNIRKGRRRPDLMPQHLMSVRAFKKVTKAEIKGNSKGSTELYFSPNKIIPGNYTLRCIKGISAVGDLPLSIAERQKKAAIALLNSEGVQPEIKVTSVPTPGRGSYIFLIIETEHIRAGFSSLGAKGKRAETVGEEAAKELVQYIRSNACLDQHLSDQILVYIALIGGHWRFSASSITEHLKTNLWVIGKFLDVKYEIKDSIVEIKSK